MYNLLYTEYMKKILIAMALVLGSLSALAQDFWLGADISGITNDEAHGRKFYDVDGQETDVLQLMKDYGMNAIRVRVWVNSIDGFSSPEDVLALCKRAKKLGLPVMIDFHYSDSWADPGNQIIPQSWMDMEPELVALALANHTEDMLQALKDAEIDVRWVQVGNETTNGMVWPLGKYPEQATNYAMFSQAGYDAVKRVYPDAQVIVHLDNGFDQAMYDDFFDTLKNNNAQWDMIGMSVYPYWAMESGKMPDEEVTLRSSIDNIKHLKNKYGTDVMIVETGYDARRPDEGYSFMNALIDQALNNTNGACRGVFYWAPEINAESQYHLGAFSQDRPTHIMDAFKESASKIR